MFWRSTNFSRELHEILLSAPQPNEKDPSDVFGAPGGLDPHAKTGRLEGG